MDKKMIVLYFAVLFMLVLNSIQHFTSPVYRHYREKTQSLEDRYTTFVKRVEAELIPSIVAVATNRNISITQPICTNGTARAERVPSPLRINAVSYVCAGNWCFQYRGFDFRVGDCFGGSRILDINNLGMSTSRCSYIFGKDEEMEGGKNESRTAGTL